MPSSRRRRRSSFSFVSCCCFCYRMTFFPSTNQGEPDLLNSCWIFLVCLFSFPFPSLLAAVMQSHLTFSSFFCFFIPRDPFLSYIRPLYFVLDLTSYESPVQLAASWMACWLELTSVRASVQQTQHTKRSPSIYHWCLTTVSCSLCIDLPGGILSLSLSLSSQLQQPILVSRMAFCSRNGRVTDGFKQVQWHNSHGLALASIYVLSSNDFSGQKYLNEKKEI